MHAKDLPELSVGDTVRFRVNESCWARSGKVSGHANAPRSYLVEGNDGKFYRRNRRDVLRTPGVTGSKVDDEWDESLTSDLGTDVFEQERDIGSGCVEPEAVVPNDEGTLIPDLVPEKNSSRPRRVPRKPG